MTQTLDDFTYVLPPDRIAQSPASPRESAKLMIIHRTDQTIEHKHVSNLPEYLSDTDVLVINNTKVFKARLRGKTPQGSSVELFLIRPCEDNSLEALGKPGKKIHIGDAITIAEDFVAHVISKSDSGIIQLQFNLDPATVIDKANTYGEIPIPPYIKKIPTDGSYQTVYASQIGSVAAPTAGFHLTTKLLQQIREKGIQIIEVTLHVGIGTFMPIKTYSLESHTMHSEWVHVSESAADALNRSKKLKKRIVAIGTTTVRTLEGVASIHNGVMKAYTGDVNLFIKPGYSFHFVDALLTNFHLPKSTLLVLVSSLTSTPLIKRAYAQAIENNYRFYSFGDAMFIC